MWGSSNTGTQTFPCFAGQDDFGAETFRAADFAERRAFRDVDRRLNAQSAGVIGEPLRMVFGRCYDDAVFPFGIGQRHQFDLGAARLERAGDLEVLKLQVHVGAG